MSRLLAFAAGLALAAAQLTSSSLENHVDTLTLGSSFNPVKEAYWTGLPHHRRTPFAVSPDGKTAFLAYLDGSGTGVHIQGVNPKTFAAVGTPITVKNGKEAGGLVAHNDGFALLTNEVVSGESKDPLPVIYKYTNGKQTFRTLLGGSGFSGNALASPDINGDLVFSEKAGYYAAYIVVTSYSGDAAGHFGDAIRYITPQGKVEEIQGASSSWGCSHNTGIAFEAADEPPFASLCSEDQGAIWLNTETQGMSNDGVKVSNEHVINGASNEPMGGMSGSYSSLARFIGADSYIFSWVSRGAVDLTLNDWMGEGYTHASNRTNNRNVAVALFSDKKTLVGEQATSKVGAKDGDSQVNWITDGANDCSNAHVAAFDASTALITWEEISNPVCEFEAMGCKGKFAGTKFQVVDSKGKKLGSAITSDDTYVAGDMVTMSDGRICWPYVNMAWSLNGPTQAADVKKISFACISNGSGSDSGSGSASKVSTAVAQPSATKTADKGASKPSIIKSAAAADISFGKPAGLPKGAPRPSFATVPDSVTDILSPPTEIISSGTAEKPSKVVIKPSAPATTISSGDSSAIPKGAPRPSFVTVPDSVSDVLSAPTKVASSNPVGKPSKVVIKPSAPATTISSGNTSTIPKDAPRPSFVTVPDSVSDILSAPTETTSSDVCEEPSSAVIKPSVPAVPKAGETDTPADCDDGDSDKAPVSTQAPTKAPLETTPSKSKPANGEDDCDGEEAGNAPVTTNAPAETIPTKSKPTGGKEDCDEEDPGNKTDAPTNIGGDEDCDEDEAGNAPVTTQAPAETDAPADCDEEDSENTPVETSPAKPKVTDIVEDCNEYESGNGSVETDAPLETIPTYTGDKEDCDEEEPRNAPVATQAPPKAPKPSGRRPRTRTQTRYHTRRPGHTLSNKNECVATTVTQTVYVTATAVPGY